MFESISPLMLSLLCGSAFTSAHGYWENHSFETSEKSVTLLCKYTAVGQTQPVCILWTDCTAGHRSRGKQWSVHSLHQEELLQASQRAGCTEEFKPHGFCKAGFWASKEDVLQMSFSRFPALSFPPYSYPGVPDSAVVPSHPPLVLVINRICFCYSCRQTWLMLEHLGARDRGESLVFYLSISRSYVPDSLTPVQVSQPGCTPQGSQGQAVNLYLWL